ncbi:hypothetical protein ACFQ51_50505 [Streptomyces kaempferi]
MSIDQRSSEAPPTSTPPSRTAWLVLTVVVMADVMDLIDSSIATLAARPSTPTSAAASPPSSGC